MKKFLRNSITNIVVVFSMLILLGFTGITIAYASSPDLGVAASFGILGGTYTNTTTGTSIHNGDVGYSTGPAMPPTMVGGTIYGISPPTPQARADATTALGTLNGMTCLPGNNLGGIVDLSLVHGATYTPGVYCSTGAMSIGTAGITLNGAGTYVFRANGALHIVTGSTVNLTGAPAASACDVFWTPTAATTFDAGTNFSGTIIDNNNAITVGTNTTWLGRALSLLAGTITTDADSITVPNCSAPTLTVNKTVNNTHAGIKGILDFSYFLDGFSILSGVASTTSVGLHTVSETPDSGYTTTIGGDCSTSGTVTLAYGGHGVCTITNNDIAPPPSVTATLHIIKEVVNTGGGTATSSDFTIGITGTNVSTSSIAGSAIGVDVTLDAGSYVVAETGSQTNYTAATSTDCSGSILAGATKTCTITNTYTAPVIPPPGPYSGRSSGSTHYGCKDPLASNYEYLASSNPALCVYGTVSVITATTTVIMAATVPVPGLPDTGLSPQSEIFPELFKGWDGFLFIQSLSF